MFSSSRGKPLIGLNEKIHLVLTRLFKGSDKKFKNRRAIVFSQESSLWFRVHFSLVHTTHYWARAVAHASSLSLSRVNKVVS